MPFAPFTTHNGLLIYVREDEGQFVVCIVGEREKELFKRSDEADAIEYAEALQAQYEKMKVDADG